MRCHAGHLRGRLRQGVAGVVVVLVLALAGSGCKYIQDEFTFLDRAAPPAPPEPGGTDADR